MKAHRYYLCCPPARRPVDSNFQNRSQQSVLNFDNCYKEVTMKEAGLGGSPKLSQAVSFALEH